MDTAGHLALVLWCVLALIQVASVAAAAAQPIARRKTGGMPQLEPVSIVIPTRRPEPDIIMTLKRLACLDYPRYEVIIAGAERDERLSAWLDPFMRHPVAFGHAVASGPSSGNPKVDAMAAGFERAQHEIILFADDNIAVPSGWLRACLVHLGGETGLVSAAVVGVAAENFTAEIEAAFMNGYGARYLLAADRLGYGVAMGKSMLLRRRDLERAGGIAILAQGICEDSVIRERLAAIGFRTALCHRTLTQILGRRRLDELIERQVRWFSCRRAHAPPVYALEPFAFAITGAALAAMAAALTALCPAWLAFLGSLGLWYLVDAGASILMRWPLSLSSPAAWLAREILTPFVWASALVRRRVQWRGSPFAIRGAFER